MKNGQKNGLGNNAKVQITSKGAIYVTNTKNLFNSEEVQKFIKSMARANDVKSTAKANDVKSTAKANNVKSMAKANKANKAKLEMTEASQDAPSV